MPPRPLLFACGGLLILAVVFGLIVGHNRKPTAKPTPEPTGTSLARKSSGSKFGAHSRSAEMGNVDVGVRTIVAPSAEPTTAPKKREIAQAQPRSTSTPLSTARPTATPEPPPQPVPLPPKYPPLPSAPTGTNKEVVVAYAKGETGKRQIYLRSLERDRDDPVFTDPYDDYGVAFSSAAQKVAFYSNEEGASDQVKSRTKLKVVDLGSGKMQLIASDLPGSAPVAWSPDGRFLAIPTASSLLLSDTVTGNTLQVLTGRNPAGIVWSPSGTKLYFQANVGSDNTDIFEADAITAAARAVVSGETSETLPALSQDGTQLLFLRVQPSGGATVVVRNISSGEERNESTTEGATSFLYDLKLRDLVYARQTQDTTLERMKNGQNNQIPANLKNPMVVSWDRDYQHVFVLADDNDGRALYSVDIDSGNADVVKSGIADPVTAIAR